jgi:hypothetical protein
MEQILEGLLAGQEEMIVRLDTKIEAKMDAWIVEIILVKRDDGLLRSNGGLSRPGQGQPREDEGRPGINGGHGGCLPKKGWTKWTLQIWRPIEKFGGHGRPSGSL